MEEYIMVEEEKPRRRGKVYNWETATYDFFKDFENEFTAIVYNEALTSKLDFLTEPTAQLNCLRKEIKKVNEKVYAAQVGCELCKGPHYTKDCLLKEEGKPLKKLTIHSLVYPTNLEHRKRHEENSNIIKEIRASTNAAIRNQGASVKTLEIQIGQMSKVLQERGFESLPSSTETNPKDHIKSISTAKADLIGIRRIGSSPYAISDSQFSNVFSEIIPFPRGLHNYCCDEWKEARELNILETYSIRTTLHDNTLP
uniref:MAK10-like protein n=1 Tax=Tanacetum cinerariifolium TaxID=118510 RepID=A0A6L2P4U6_TANCI|nr:hypothetical protein [Tanacetum cinerariifolium]